MIGWPSSSFWKDPHTFYWETSICLCEIIKSKTCSCYDKVSNLSVSLLQCRSAQQQLLYDYSKVSTCDLVPKCRNRTDARCSILKGYLCSKIIFRGPVFKLLNYRLHYEWLAEISRIYSFFKVCMWVILHHRILHLLPI